MSAFPEPANLADVVRARVANALQAQGVRPRERIAYLGKNSDIYFELLMGAMKANG
jgi:acyl-CoA synthetase (AMP-forming)/AMP-acid ligase II